MTTIKSCQISGEYCIPTGQAYSGIVMAKREYRPDLLPIMFTKKSTRIFDSVTDVPLDGNGQEARVIDIIVYKQPKTNTAVAPKVMEQLDKYANAYRDFANVLLMNIVKSWLRPMVMQSLQMTLIN